MFNSYRQNTLELYPDRCIGCSMCVNDCPHAVFAVGERKPARLLSSRLVASLANKEACMECGACQMNCPVAAVRVQSGVGCAAAMIRAALTGGPETCGEGGCCGNEGSPAGSSCGCQEK